MGLEWEEGGRNQRGEESGMEEQGLGIAEQRLFVMVAVGSVGFGQGAELSSEEGEEFQGPVISEFQNQFCDQTTTTTKKKDFSLLCLLSFVLDRSSALDVEKKLIKTAFQPVQRR